MKWLKDNWDKLATLILGGLVGYFAGVMATNNRISELGERVRTVETKAQTIYDAKALLTDAHVLELIRLQNGVTNLRDQQQLTDKFIEVHAKEIKLELDKVRTGTITELREFLQASHVASHPPPNQ